MTSDTPRQLILHQARILFDGKIYIFASLLLSLLGASIYIWRTPAKWMHHRSVQEAPLSQVSPLVAYVSLAYDLPVSQVPAVLVEAYMKQIPQENQNKRSEYLVFANANSQQKSKEIVTSLLEDAHKNALGSLIQESSSRLQLLIDKKKLEIKEQKKIIFSHTSSLLTKRFLTQYLNNQTFVGELEGLMPPANFSGEIVSISGPDLDTTVRQSTSPAMIYSIAIIAGLLIGCFLAITRSIFKE
jgi:hypothetical protein